MLWIILAVILAAALVLVYLFFTSDPFEWADRGLSYVTADGRVSPDFELDGSGENVDSIAFWETADEEDMLLFTTAKANQLVEVWRYPFVDNEETPLTHSSFGSSGTQVNGVAIDQENDQLYIVISDPESTVALFALPDLRFDRELISGAHDLRSEPNIDLLAHSDGRTLAYISADDTLYIYDTDSGAAAGRFQPLRGLETVLADDFHQVIYVPDENDQSGIYAYHPDGTPYLRDGRSQFGHDVFQSDAEGILLYRCPGFGADDGTGFIVVADQLRPLTQFEFFDRQTWRHLGTLLIDGVSNTDGIASTQQPLTGYPLGIFAANNDDTSTIGAGWDKVLRAMNLSCS